MVCVQAAEEIWPGVTRSVDCTPARYLTAGLNYQVTLAGRNFAGWQLDTNLYIYICIYLYYIYIY